MRTFLFLLLLLAGCVPEHKKEMAAIKEAPTLSSSMDQALSREDFQQGEWPSEQWWELFEDPQLNDLIERGLQDSPTLKTAQARVQEAEQTARAERARLLPHLKAQYLEQWQYFSKNGFVESFYPSIPGISFPATANQIDLTLNFEYEFDFWGKNRKLYQAALGQQRARQAEASQATLMLLTSIAQTYFHLQANLAQREILLDKKDKRTELYELTSHRNRAGIDPVMQTLSAEKTLYDVDQALFIVEREIQLNYHLLNILIGKGPDEPALELPLIAASNRPFPLPEQLTADLLARRPDLQAQIWLVEAAAKEIGAAKADFYPNINLSAFGGLESLAFRNLFKTSSKMGGLVPAISLPIFTGGRLTAQLKGKVAAFNEAVFHYNELILKAAQDVADQLIILQTKKDELHVQMKALTLTDEQYYLSLSRFLKGVSTYLNTLNDEEHFLNQQLIVVNLYCDVNLATLQLIRALGGGYHAPYQEKRS